VRKRRRTRGGGVKSDSRPLHRRDGRVKQLNMKEKPEKDQEDEAVQKKQLEGAGP
jgi:hypothetical protein